MSDQEIFHLVEEKVYRVIGSMLAEGFPITEFVGGRKNKDSLYTKLLSKRETVAAQIYDKLRFRIVTRERDDIFPVLQYLTKKLFPFNYVIPGQSINSIFHFKSYCESNAAPRKRMLEDMQAGADEDSRPSDNSVQRDNYRVIHFVVDMPVRLPQEAPRARSLERVGARADRLRHLRVPGHRPRDRGRERAGRGRRMQSTRNARKRPSCAASSSACASSSPRQDRHRPSRPPLPCRRSRPLRRCRRSIHRHPPCRLPRRKKKAISRIFRSRRCRA